MKFKRANRKNQSKRSSGFRTHVEIRKEQRKLRRIQKKKNRAKFSTGRQGKSPNNSENDHARKSNTKKFNELTAYVEAEKIKMKKMDASCKPVNKFSGAVSSAVKKNKLAKNKNPLDSSDEELQEDVGGFKLASSNTDRMAKLQAFVNQEAGISDTREKKLKKKKGLQGETSGSGEERPHIISDKQELKKLRNEQQEDTKEINRLSKLLGYKKPNQKKKVAPIFAADFGGLLEDIEDGTMANSDKYKNDEKELGDSDEEFEKDMAIALGQQDVNKGKDYDKSLESNLLESNTCNRNEGFTEGHMENETSTEEEDYNSDEDRASSTSDDEDSLETEDNLSNGNLRKASDDDYTGNDFLDSEAEEASDEESESDGDLMHDIRHESSFAFEGGCNYYSKPEILKNGQENDIDRYSSNSDDDEDLEDFVVGNDEVEYEEASDELPDEYSDSFPVKTRKRIIVSSDDDDSQVDGVYFIPSNDSGKSENTKKKKINVSRENKKKIYNISNDSIEEEDSDNNNLPDKAKKTKKRRCRPIESSGDECGPSSPLRKKTKATQLAQTDSDVTETCVNNVNSNSVTVVLLSDSGAPNKKLQTSDDSCDVKKEKKKKKKKHIPGGDELLSILKKQSESDQDKSLNEKTKKKKKKKKKARVSFDVPQGADSESEEKPRNKLPGHVRKLTNVPDVTSNESDGVYEDCAQFSGCEESGSVGSAEFSEADEIPQATNEISEQGGLTEDIYGRLRDKEGNVVQKTDDNLGSSGRYVPPALRKLMALNTDEKKKERLARLRKTLKGLLNRLAESNMAGITNQIEEMYVKHSRNDMSDTLTKLFFESLVAPTLTPERLVQEHAMLVAVLSANVGSEVGAHILNEFVLKWTDAMQELRPDEEVESKEVDNLLLFIANLYNFKVMAADLIFDILNQLAQGFTHKEVELILLVLRSVGFTLRKDDPLALKSLITNIQGQASKKQAESQESTEYTRICFMLEVVQAIRNNNMAKVPNYDPSHVEHLKKVLKGLMRQGCQISPLKVSLEDLVKSRECGRWWIVGSAWSGNLPGEKPPEQIKYSSSKKNFEEELSEKFKRKAAKLQLSRPPRINILFIITEGSQDYLDAFDKLLQLSLPPQQERELFTVILLCCQKSKNYNPFFAHVSVTMCKFDKKYKRLLQFALRDKFEEMESIKLRAVANLAKFMTHLVAEDSLNLSVLKNISFMEVESQMISFLRQMLIGLLVHPTGADTVERVFSALCASPKLQVLRQSLRLFIIKFLSSKKSKEDSAEQQMLTRRIQEAVEILSSGGGVRL